MRFPSQWRSGETAGGRGPEPPRRAGAIESRLEQAQRVLQLQIDKLDHRETRLRRMDAALFARIITALQERDAHRASMYATELTEIRRIRHVVMQAQIVLEQLVMRVGTVKQVGELASTLYPAASALRSVRNQVVEVLPEAGREFTAVGELLNGLLVELRSTRDGPSLVEHSDRDAEDILADAASLAERRLRSALPVLPQYTNQPTAAPEALEE